MLKFSLAAALLTVSVLGTAPANADSDPSMHQIYEAAQSGHLDQAQQMMNQVLRDHPNSGKAHFVAAELSAKAGKTDLARSELRLAEQFAPGLPFAKPQSLQALKAEIGLSPRTMNTAPRMSPTPSVPWGSLLVLAAAIGLLWRLFRRRSTNNAQYPAGSVPSGSAPGGYGGPGGGPGGYGPGVGPMGGAGSGIVGALASGLAVGAGVVAGEELAHHFLDGGRHAGSTSAPENFTNEAPANGDMGGSDFGVDAPGSWDDGGSSGGDSGGDWS